MSLPPAFVAEVRDRLVSLAEDRGIPGAVLAVLHDDEVHEWSTGVTSLSTGVEVTPEAVFQIGSITKVWTATLIMQLVDEDRVELDAPVRTYLPDLRFADPVATERTTVRHLLTHTSGVDGDVFEDFGRGDDAVARYVEACAGATSVMPPGAGWSYCNLGFVVLGRVVEVLTGMPWHRALRDRLVAPLGLATPVALAEEAIVFRASSGHLRDRATGRPRPAETWQLAQATAPAGGTPAARARDLLSFARMHLDGGLAQEGSRVLSETATVAMQEPQAEVPSASPGGDLWGLGWSVNDWDGVRAIGHGGLTIGQSAELRILPDRRIALALLMNAETGGPLVEAIETFVLGELAEVTVPPRPAPPETPAPVVDPARYEGVYERRGYRREVAWTGSALRLSSHYSGPLSELYPDPDPDDLIPADERTFFAYDPDADDRVPILFLGLEEGGHAHAMFDGRVAPRVGGGVGL